MSIFFNHNGKLHLQGTAIIGPGNRGLRYGDGLFETMKVTAGKLCFADDHLSRLWKGMALLQFERPKHFSPEMLEAEIMALVKKNGHETLGRVRLNVFRGNGGLYDPEDHRPNYTIETWALPAGTGEWNSNGLVLGIYTAARKSCDDFANLKHNNYLPYCMAALHAKKERWNDALLLNTYGRVCDSTVANVFVVKNQQVFTPALGEGCVEGVMRGQLIGLLKAKDIPVTETAISIEFLLSADELLLTNSIHGVRWVQSLEDKNYSNEFIVSWPSMLVEYHSIKKQ